jgi:hypothetical protein
MASEKREPGVPAKVKVAVAYLIDTKDDLQAARRMPGYRPTS